MCQRQLKRVYISRPFKNKFDKKIETRNCL